MFAYSPVEKNRQTKANKPLIKKVKFQNENYSAVQMVYSPFQLLTGAT